MASRAVEKGADAKVLYITYDGITDPLGRSQILPYLTGLARCGHRITILSCEKPDRMARDGDRIRKICNDAGIGWEPLRYRKQPPILSSMLDAVALKRRAVRLQRRHRFDIVHCRSYIPAGVGLALKQRFGVRFLFDMRGFWPDEKVEGRNWDLRNPLYRAVYRYFKWLEAKLLRGADHIVSLTEAGKRQLLTRRELVDEPKPITVIPCCVDFSHFPLATEESRTAAREHLGIARNAPVLAYLGSLGSWYMLDEMLDFFRVYSDRYPGARFLFVTHEEPQALRRAAAERGIAGDQLVIAAATREEVPRLMAAADLGIFFIKPVFSKAASSPTKMGEMLAIGLPIVTNAGVGDVDLMIAATNSGLAIPVFQHEDYVEAIARVAGLSGSAGDRREAALQWFDVTLGIGRYHDIYQQLAEPFRPQATQ